MIRNAILKTISYAVMHMSIAILIAYILSGNWKVALAIGLLEPCVQTVAYFFHERTWHNIEKNQKTKDAHNEVIDSTSPFSKTLEKFLKHRH